jgi:hypothetical protein
MKTLADGGPACSGMAVAQLDSVAAKSLLETFQKFGN